MPSRIDPTSFADGQPVSKAELRAALSNAKAELEHGGFFKVNVGGAIERRVADKLGERVSVKDLGAKGDDSTDDAAAIRAAIATGRKLYFPPGVYRVGSALTYDPAKGLDIEGESPNYATARWATIVGTFSTDEPVIHSTGGYLNKDNVYVEGSEPGKWGYLHSVSLRSIGVTANATFGQAAQFYNVVNPSCFRDAGFAGAYRGLLVAQGFDVEIDNCRFAMTAHVTHGFADETLMFKAFGLCYVGHGSIKACSAVGAGVGFWLQGHGLNVGGLRSEENYVGVRLGGLPNMGVDLTYETITRSVLGGMSIEACYDGMRIDQIGEGTVVQGINAQGSPKGDGRAFDSRYGIVITKAGQQTTLEGFTAGGNFTHAPIKLPGGCLPTMRSISGYSGAETTNFPKGVAGGNGLFGQQNGFSRLFSVNKIPVNYVRHGHLDPTEHTITAYSDLQLRGIKGLDVYNSNIQPNNLGKIETLPNGATTKAVAFRALLQSPSFEIQPTSETDVASTLAAGTYYYACSFIRRGGETSPVIPSPVTVTGTGKRVKLQVFGTSLADALRVYRGTAAGRWDGCFETTNFGVFYDTGQAFTSTKEWPLDLFVDIPAETEADPNYAVVVTPSWNTKCWVTAKSANGFTINFDAAAPVGATVQWLLFRP